MDAIYCQSCGSPNLTLKGRLYSCQNCGRKHVINPNELENLVPLSETDPELIIPQVILIGELLRDKGYLVSNYRGYWDSPISNYDFLWAGEKQVTTHKKGILWWKSVETQISSNECLKFMPCEDSDRWRLFVLGREHIEVAKKIGRLIQNELGYKIEIILVHS